MTFIILGWLVTTVAVLAFLMSRGKIGNDDSVLFWALFWPVGLVWMALERMAVR